MWQEFKPTIFFLLKFFGIYLCLSWIYGIYIASYDTQKQPVVDPFTHHIAEQCGNTAELFGYDVFILKNAHQSAQAAPEQTFSSMWFNGIQAVAVEEGCNGLNIMILFVAFVIAFGGKIKNMLIFTPLGLGFIYLANLGRILLLSLLNVELQGNAFHFFHKYGFTAIIYAAVLFLWYLWVMHFSGRYKSKASSVS
jgi:exosortase family protein XrtF